MRNIHKEIDELSDRVLKIEHALEFHGFIMGEFDLDQIRQDSHREKKDTCLKSKIIEIGKDIIRIKKKINEISEVINNE